MGVHALSGRRGKTCFLVRDTIGEDGSPSPHHELSGSEHILTPGDRIPSLAEDTMNGLRSHVSITHAPAVVARVTMPAGGVVEIPVDGHTTAGSVLAMATSVPPVTARMDESALFAHNGVKLLPFEFLLPLAMSQDPSTEGGLSVASLDTEQNGLSPSPSLDGIVGSLSNPTLELEGTTGGTGGPAVRKKMDRSVRMARKEREKRRKKNGKGRKGGEEGGRGEEEDLIEIGGVVVCGSRVIHLHVGPANPTAASAFRLSLIWEGSFSPGVNLVLSRRPLCERESVGLVIMAMELFGLDPAANQGVLEAVIRKEEDDDGDGDDGVRRLELALRVNPDLDVSDQSGFGGMVPLSAWNSIGQGPCARARPVMDPLVCDASVYWDKNVRRARRLVRRKAALKSMLRLKQSLKRKVKALREQQVEQQTHPGKQHQQLTPLSRSIAAKRASVKARNEVSKRQRRMSKVGLLTATAQFPTELEDVYGSYLWASSRVKSLKATIRSLVELTPLDNV